MSKKPFFNIDFADSITYEGDKQKITYGSCYIIYKIGTDTIYIDEFRCPNKTGNGRKLLHDLLLHLLPYHSNYHALINICVNAKDKEKYTKYYEKIGFAQMSERDQFTGEINNIINTIHAMDKSGGKKTIHRNNGRKKTVRRNATRNK